MEENKTESVAKSIYFRKAPEKIEALCPLLPWRSSGLRSDIQDGR